jgi:hypothetical protein
VNGVAVGRHDGVTERLLPLFRAVEAEAGGPWQQVEGEGHVDELSGGGNSLGGGLVIRCAAGSLN